MSSKSSFYNSTGVTNTQSNAIDASVDNAEASALASENSANSASTSASTATTKASEASTSASTATTKASEASTSAATATTKASESASSATASANSATSASTSASTATTKASEASSSASTALSHKNDAQTAKTAAETAETNAETAETNAASSATAASTSASSASTSATTATTKANEAAASASTATTKASEAATSASNASTSASTATTKASEASTSATNAASSASSAQASKDAALAALDNFDDRYLGVKSSNPSTDNDGNALVAGSLYFNSTDDTMKVYEGSAWVAAYASLSGAVLQANNLSDLTSASDARANLGLGTAATTAATAYATAAQGTLATNALPKAGGTMTGNLNVGGTVTADAGSWSTVVSGNAITFDRNGENNIIADSGSSANLNLTAGNRIFYSADDYQSFKIGSSPTEKLRILSTGIDVTGTVTSDSGYFQGSNSFINDTMTLNFTAPNGQIAVKNSSGSPAANLYFYTTDASGNTNLRQNISYNGDISFYEDTGTTAKFFWDSSAESLGIGTSSPATFGVLAVKKDQTADTAISVSNAGTASASTTMSFALTESGTTQGWLRRYRDGTGNTEVGFSDALLFSGNVTGSKTERMRIDSSGNLLVGLSSQEAVGTNAGTQLRADGLVYAAATSDAHILSRRSSDGAILNFRKDTTTVGSIGVASTSFLTIGGTSANHGGLRFDIHAVLPMEAGTQSDNTIDLGSGSYRYDDVFATNGTIQTSDRNEKQDIAELSDAEQRVAVAAKGLLRKFRWKDAVAEKGDEARTHFGIIAQDLQAAFAAEGLDAGDYAMFISSTWTDEETGEERTRMGVRYSELLAFIIAAI